MIKESSIKTIIIWVYYSTANMEDEEIEEVHNNLSTHKYGGKQYNSYKRL